MSYTIKLLSRNLTNPSTIDSTDITSNVISGFSFVEKLDESLDIGSITIRGVNRFKPYDLFDTIEVSYNSVVKFSMRVGGDSVRLISKSPNKYEHTLTLIEHTKILERFIINGKTFTQPTDGTVRYYLYDTIEDLNNVTPLKPTSEVSTTRIFEMPTGSLATYLQSVESPEFTFKDITYREALNQICGYVEGIPRLVRESDGTLRLTIDFVNEQNSLIPSNAKLLNHSRQQDNDFYATTIISEAQNLVSDTTINEAVEIYPSQGSWITPRSDKYVFNYEDSYIYTPKRIYNVNKLEGKNWCRVKETRGASTYYYYDAGAQYYYYDDILDFPVIGVTGYKYVDMSDSNATYYWDGSNYQTEVTDPADTTNPKIRLYETFADFTTGNAYLDVSSGGDTIFIFDLFIDLSTGNSYRYDTTNQFVSVEGFDAQGILVTNLTDRVYEESIWNTLETEGATVSDDLNPDNYFKSNTVRYVYRQKNILLGETSGLFSTGVEIQNISQIKTFETLKENGFIWSGAVYSDYEAEYFVSSGAKDDIDYNYAQFKVHYTPIPTNQRVEIERQDISEVFYESQMLANQQARTLNLQSFANNLEGRINRIGNSELEISNKILNLNSSNYYNINDYTDDDFVVTERETIVFKDFCLVKYGLTKNYNMISKFIGVNSEIRQYEMGENNTLQRVLSTKEYIEIDAVNSGNGSKDSNYFTTNGVTCFLDTFNINSDFEPVRGGLTYFNTTTFPNLFTLTPFSSNGGGNTLMFFQQQPNNAYNDTRNEVSGIYGTQITKEFIKYTNTDDAFAIDVAFNLFDDIGKEQIFIDDDIDSANAMPNISSGQPVSSQDIKKIYINSPALTVNKDNREEIGQLHSIHLLSKDVNKVILGRGMATKNRMVTEKPPTSLKLYTYDTEKLSKSDNFTLKSGYDTSATLLVSEVTIDYSNYKVTISHSNLTASKSAWVLTDENDRVILGVNQDGTLLNVITFDLNKERSGIKYKY